ncbi:MAG TPA: hypothetical protein VGL72_18820 [Bryobacteraceae bacterium]|jgi:hypothetical protein
MGTITLQTTLPATEYRTRGKTYRPNSSGQITVLVPADGHDILDLVMAGCIILSS